METVRSFIAIELSEEAKTCLRDLQARLKECNQVPAKWVDPDSIHLTLKFLGDIPVSKIDPINKAMAAAAKGVPAFQIELKETGAFPSLRRVQIVWVGLGGDIEKLGLLQQRVESGVSPLGYTPEKRPFTPHLTLARVRENASPEQRQQLGELIAATRLESNCVVKVESVNLMRSQLTREGAIYSRLGMAALVQGSGF